MDNKHTSPWHPLYRGSGGVVGRGSRVGRGVGGVVGGVVVGLLAGFAVGGASVGAPSVQVPPCAMEDSPGPCFWDASVRGDGSGRSFTVDGSGMLTYWDTGETRSVG